MAPLPEALAEKQEKLLRILARHKVEMVVLGGVGAQFHGWKSATVDLDIAVDRGEANVVRINLALQEAGAGDPQIGQFGTAFITRFGRLELVRKADGIGEYEDWLRNAGEKELDDGLAIMVADPEDIIASKRAAGRGKDLLALDQMRADFDSTSSSARSPGT
jgi:hypothetical protein